MKGNFIKIIILIILLFVAYKSLIVGIKNFKSPSSAVIAPGEETVPQEIILPEQTSNATVLTKETKAADIVSVVDTYGRVPFISKQETKITQQEAEVHPQVGAYEMPKLTTVLNYEGRWLAVVNGSLVKAGDKIGRFRILEIKENLVNIEEAGKIYKLELWQDSISR